MFQTSGILLNHLFSTHVGTPPLVYQKGEKYKKMYGPWFLLLNRAESKSDNLDDLWYDAKKTAQKKNRLWPLEFFTSNQGEGDYPSRCKDKIKTKRIVNVPSQLLIHFFFLCSVSWDCDRPDHH